MALGVESHGQTKWRRKLRKPKSDVDGVDVDDASAAAPATASESRHLGDLYKKSGQTLREEYF